KHLFDLLGQACEGSVIEHGIESLLHFTEDDVATPKGSGRICSSDEGIQIVSYWFNVHCPVQVVRHPCDAAHAHAAQEALDLVNDLLELPYKRLPGCRRCADRWPSTPPQAPRSSPHTRAMPKEDAATKKFKPDFSRVPRRLLPLTVPNVIPQGSCRPPE